MESPKSKTSSLKKCKKPTCVPAFSQEEAIFPLKTLKVIWISYHGFKSNQYPILPTTKSNPMSHFTEIKT
jgi:hypothetical protein